MWKPLSEYFRHVSAPQRPYTRELNGKVPEESIVFLTRSQTEAEVVGKELGATVGGFMGVGTGMSAGVLAATMLAVPGIGQVFALGFGAAALLGLLGAGAGSALGKSMSGGSWHRFNPLPRKRLQMMQHFFAKCCRKAAP